MRKGVAVNDSRCRFAQTQGFGPGNQACIQRVAGRAPIEAARLHRAEPSGGRDRVTRKRGLAKTTVITLSVLCCSIPTFADQESPVAGLEGIQSDDSFFIVAPTDITYRFALPESGETVVVRVSPHREKAVIEKLSIESSIGNFDVPSEILETLVLPDYFFTLDSYHDEQTKLYSLILAFSAIVVDRIGSTKSHLDFEFNERGLVSLVIHTEDDAFEKSFISDSEKLFCNAK